MSEHHDEEDRSPRGKLIEVISVNRVRTEQNVTIRLLSIESYSRAILLRGDIIGSDSATAGDGVILPRIRLTARDDIGGEYRFTDDFGHGSIKYWEFTRVCNKQIDEDARSLDISIEGVDWRSAAQTYTNDIAQVSFEPWHVKVTVNRRRGSNT